MVKAIIIDDEERAIDSLQLMIENFVPELQVVATCKDPRNCTQIIHDLRPDLVFLDVRMPHMSGFELLGAIRRRAFHVIFTTAYDEYAIKAIRFSALDYLLKPIDAEELIAAVQRFNPDSAWSQQQEFLKNVKHNLLAQTSDEFRLALPSREGVNILPPRDIVRCEGAGNYTIFHTSDGRQIITSKSLGDYEELLAPFHFIRIHKSHLVNRDYVSYIDFDGFLVLSNSVRVEISRRRRGEVMAALRGSATH